MLLKLARLICIYWYPMASMKPVPVLTETSITSNYFVHQWPIQFNLVLFITYFSTSTLWSYSINSSMPWKRAMQLLVLTRNSWVVWLNDTQSEISFSKCLNERESYDLLKFKSFLPKTPNKHQVRWFYPKQTVFTYQIRLVSTTSILSSLDEQASSAQHRLV